MSYTRWHATWIDLPTETTPANAGFLQHVEDTFVSQDGRITTLEATGGGGTGAVTSVAGRTGVVTLAKADVGLNNVDNTSDVNKPVSTLQTTAINTGDALAIPKTLVTAKGNLIVATASGTPTNLAVGADTQVLTADSTQATGTKWATPTGGGSGIPASTVTTKGDLLAATASSTVSRLGIGSDGQFLLADSSQATGIRWGPGVNSVAGRAGTVVLSPSDISGGALTNALASAQGDIIIATAANSFAAFPRSGSVGQVLTIVSPTGSFGYNWTTPTVDIPKSLIAAQGDLIVGLSSGVPNKLGVAFTNGQVLTSNSSATLGLDWEPLPSSYTTVQDEGLSLTQRPTLNFVGPAIVANDDGSNTRTVITVNETDFCPSDHGLFGWTYDPSIPGSSAILTGGTIYLVKIKVIATTTITKIYWYCSGAGNTPTSTQNNVGIYSSTGTRLATVNVDTDISSTGLKIDTISSTSISPPFIWVAFVFNATTVPGPVRCANTFATLINVGLSAANTRYATGPTAQTSLPSTITPSSLGQGLSIWAGIAA